MTITKNKQDVWISVESLQKISNLNVFTCAVTKLTGYGQKSFCILNTLGTIKARVF